MRMGNRLAVAGVLLGSLSTAVAAQGPKASLGIQAGFNSATVHAEDPGGTDITRRSGLLAGAFLTIHAGDRVIIEPQVSYSMQGAKAAEGGTELTVKSDYIQVPVLLGVSFGARDAKVHPVIYAGPMLSFKAKCDLEFNEGGQSLNEKCDEDPDVEVVKKSTDFSVVGGLRFDIQAGSGTFRIGGQYAHGLTNTVDDPDSIKHRVWSLIVGYAFGLGN